MVANEFLHRGLDNFDHIDAYTVLSYQPDHSILLTSDMRMETDKIGVFSLP